jgi:hypothetical protein
MMRFYPTIAMDAPSDFWNFVAQFFCTKLECELIWK